ncbi:MAG TPA: isoaspartyl peptidase/L-asparaginase [Acidobacteriaceae bacterium]|jgi:beta-aspartyl-peptidase (threonine type)|nr:isoaspartyl peptidase/L-asparaginase [Acidobacteriaceae bacterium]
MKIVRKNNPILVIHGGAWAMPDDAVAAHENGIRNALAAGWAILSHGGTAVDAIQASIASMEDDEIFDAGRGSFLTRDGRVQLDALMMSGRDLRAGGVASVERIRNPIHAARLVMDRSPHVYFTGSGAESFAAEHGMQLVDNEELIIPRERERLAEFHRDEAAGYPDLTFAGIALALTGPVANLSTRRGPEDRSGSRQLPEAPVPQPPANPISESTRPIAATFAAAPHIEEDHLAPDPVLMQTAVDGAVEEGLPAELRPLDPTLHSHDTVGAIALDTRGNLAAGTSTGGTLSKSPGRVGDSSLIGCGCYADNEAAAASLTGWGEPIMKLVLGKWAVDRVRSGASPQQAASDAIAYLQARLGGRGGIILLGPDGRLGIAHNTPRMAWGLATDEGQQIGTVRHP